jgi:hypothetical protein
MTLKEVNRWLVLHDRATAQAGDEGSRRERAVAQTQLDALEDACPGIEARAKAIQKIVDLPYVPGADLPGEPAAGKKKAPAWSATLGDVLKAVLVGQAAGLADTFAGEVSGAGRLEALEPGDVVLKAHTCAPDQVCLEVRMRKRDVLRAKTLDQTLRQIGIDLMRAAR